jgi:hypothetical protein
MPSPDRAVRPDDHETLLHGLTNEQDRQLREDISFGIEAKKFLTSDLAEHITYIAEDKVIAAHKALVEADPHDFKEIAKHQNTIARYGFFYGCLQEIVAAGQSAYQSYLDEHSNEN